MEVGYPTPLVVIRVLRKCLNQQIQHYRRFGVRAHSEIRRSKLFNIRVSMYRLLTGLNIVDRSMVHSRNIAWPVPCNLPDSKASRHGTDRSRFIGVIVVLNDEVPRQSDAEHRAPQPPAHLDINQRKRDRDAEFARDDVIESADSRVVIFGSNCRLTHFLE